MGVTGERALAEPAGLQVLLTPADFGALTPEDLAGATCVVFDILRATSTIVTALDAGAAAVIPVADIEGALAWRRRDPSVLLGGERHGVRIGPELTGGVAFDLGNSPREHTPERVAGHTIVTTTTNGTRALHACRGAASVLAAAFLDLGAVAAHLLAEPPARLLLVCSGTYEEAAYEDTLAAGALADRLWDRYGPDASDSAQLARTAWRAAAGDLLGAMAMSRNARRLLAHPTLAGDVAACLRIDVSGTVARLEGDRLLATH
ncbi:MAG: 2-phosphosulfolactate phosphatase [Chloroflexota bacterium]